MSKIICWWSGGITSAMACKLAIDIYGKDRCRVIFMDTKNEHPDTYRFMKDCEVLYGVQIETITAIGVTYDSIQHVWEKHLSLNVANGAICSSKLKRKVREDWQKENEYDHQVFGFEFDKKEFNRALALASDHPKAKPIFPLLMVGMNKGDCFEAFKKFGVEIPATYRLGWGNNNCFGTGCVQGGIGYWQKIKKDFPEKFEAMAAMEHKLTDAKGHPVTMLKDQSNDAKKKAKVEKYTDLVFLKKHPSYDNKTIEDWPTLEVEPLTDCNGFCGTNDLNPKSKTEEQLNYET